MELKEMTGFTVGRLTVKKFSHMCAIKKHAIWLCECSCGRETEVRGYNLRAGKTLSCGCIRREKSIERAAARKAASNAN